MPTNRCFDDALDIVEAMVLEDPQRAHDPTLTVVHGICLIPEDQPEAGQPFAHAWVEHGPFVLQGAHVNGERIFYQTDAVEILPELRVQEQTRYSLAQVLEHNRASGHYGPWEKRYEALLRKSRKGVA